MAEDKKEATIRLDTLCGDLANIIEICGIGRAKLILSEFVAEKCPVHSSNMGLNTYVIIMGPHDTEKWGCGAERMRQEKETS